MERLQKVLAQAGVASRRRCEELIVQGSVQVNGEVVRELGTKVDPERDHIVVNGKPVRLERHVYLILNKPTGVITSLSDPQGRRVVTDLLKGVKERVYPVGRLDYDTSGLLLLTNDGDLANKLAHPRYEIDKVYRAWVKGVPTAEKLKRLATGVQLEDGMTSPGKARLLKTSPGKEKSWIELTIHEGRNRQVRRMCEAIGHPVLALERVRLGFLTLDGLQAGQFRPLTPAEVQQLRQDLEQKRKLKPRRS